MKWYFWLILIAGCGFFFSGIVYAIYWEIRKMEVRAMIDTLYPENPKKKIRSIFLKICYKIGILGKGEQDSRRIEEARKKI